MLLNVLSVLSGELRNNAVDYCFLLGYTFVFYEGASSHTKHVTQFYLYAICISVFCLLETTSRRCIMSRLMSKRAIFLASLGKVALANRRSFAAWHPLKSPILDRSFLKAQTLSG